LFGAILGILVVVGIAQMGCGMYREPIAKKEAMDFCSTVRVGQSIEGIQERAIESGAVKPFAKWKAQGDGSQTMAVIYVGMPPFSRHICSIKATTTFVSAEYVYLD
jgi:hypothetical protein